MPLLQASQANAAGLQAIPGDPGLPVIRRNLEMLLGNTTNNMGAYERFGPVSWGKALGVTYVSATGPEAAAEVLVNKNKTFSNEQGWQQFIGPFFDRGLMLMDFSEHHLNRRIMQNAFVRPKLQGYLASMTPIINTRVDSWAGDIEFFPSITALGLDVATHAFMGQEPGEDTERMMHAFHACTQASLAVVRSNVPGTTWARATKARAILEEYVAARIPAARAEKREDLLSALCHVETEQGERFSDEDVVNHMIFLLMAAHDTSVSAMTSMVYYLGRNRQWQQRCREESEAVGEVLLYSDVDDLASLDLVMKEAMRLVSPLPSMARRALVDTEIQGYFVPKGTYVNVTVQLNHWLPDVWADPMVFDPARFAAPRSEDKAARFAYLPFGGGVHKCIGLYFAGMEIKSVLHRMLLKYDWSVPENYTLPLSYKALPYPKDGLPVTLNPR